MNCDKKKMCVYVCVCVFVKYLKIPILFHSLEHVLMSKIETQWNVHIMNYSTYYKVLYIEISSRKRTTELRTKKKHCMPNMHI